MFEKGDTVYCKWTNQTALVSHVDSDELMTVRFKAKFIKGGFESYGVQVLIKNFDLAK